MKQKDILTLVLVGGLAAIISFSLSNRIITPSDKTETVEVVQTIETDFVEPDTRYYNDKAINPAQKIQIGQDPDSQPFIRAQ